MVDLSYTSYVVQERMMRIGIESRCVQSPSNEDLYRIVVQTIKQDQIQHNQPVDITLSNNLHLLFANQLQPGTSQLFYFMADNNGVSTIFSTVKLEELCKLGYTSGKKMPGSSIPRLYKNKQYRYSTTVVQ